MCVEMQNLSGFILLQCVARLSVKCCLLGDVLLPATVHARVSVLYNSSIPNLRGRVCTMPPKAKTALARIKTKFSKKPACSGSQQNSSWTLGCVKLIMAWIHQLLRTSTPAGCSLPHGGKLIVGSACTGLGSELLALDMLGIAYTECFGCEVNKKLQALAMKMHNYHHFYDDCCTANFLSSPTCHVFVCGAPCQPYSKAGLQKALHDPKNGEVLLWVLAWICGHQPEAFILENVEGLCTTHRETLNIILGVLARMQDSKGKKLYHVEHRVLNLCVHGHIPQNRSRLFVVGLRLDRLQGREFSWPCEAACHIKLILIGFRVWVWGFDLCPADSDSTSERLCQGKGQARTAEQHGSEEPDISAEEVCKDGPLLEGQMGH